MASLLEINDQLRGIVTPDLLLKVYKLVIPWHKSCKAKWEEVGHNLIGFVPEQQTHAVYQALFYKVWAPISRISLEDLMKVDMLDLPLSLFTRKIQHSNPSVHLLAKEVEMHDYALWLIRLVTALLLSPMLLLGTHTATMP